MGGQGAVAFGHHAHDANRELAVKFFFEHDAFTRERDVAQIKVRVRACQHRARRLRRERQNLATESSPCACIRSWAAGLLRNSVCIAMLMSTMQAIQEVMPPVFSVVESAQALSTAQFPPPLNVAPLPPMIIVEKGESLDEFILRRHPDFFTAIQARAYPEPALNKSLDQYLRASSLNGALCTFR